MSQAKSKKDLVDQFLADTPKDLEYFVQHTMDFSVQLSSFLSKNKMSQRELSVLLGKEESEISKWLSGNHNFTFRSISKIEAALERQLLFTREEIIERFLPFLFRNWKSTYFEKDKIDSLITHYTLSEDIENSFPLGLNPNANFEMTFSTKETPDPPIKKNIEGNDKESNIDSFKEFYLITRLAA